MATKVGAFKKDGTVQCVKLVEEAPTSLVSSFGGTISGGGIDLDNGYRLQFKSGSSWDTAVNKTTFPNNFVGLNIWIENNQFSTYGIWFSREGKTNRCTATFNESSYEDRAPIIWEDTKPIKMYFNQLTIEEEASGGYDRSYFASTYLAMYNRNKELIFYYTFTGYDMDSVYGEYVTPGTVPYSDRWKTATVRMCKDGTLKCAKLIEEAAVEDSSRLSMSQKTDALTLSYFNYDIRLLNPGGQSITIPSSYSELGYVTLLDSSGTQLNFSRSYSEGDDWTGSKNPSWISGTVSIVRFTVGGTIKDSASQIAFVDNGTKQTQSARTIYFTKDSSGYYNNTSTPVTFNYDWLLKTPTVRVYKDGTIKCAEVQEANSWSHISWDNGTLETDGTISLPNGYKFRLKNSSGVIKNFTSYFSFSLDSEYVNIIYLSGNNENSSVSVDNSDYSLDEKNLIDRIIFNSPSQTLTIGDYFEMTNPKGEIYRLTCNEVEGGSAFFAKYNSLDSLMPVPITDRAYPQWV